MNLMRYSAPIKLILCFFINFYSPHTLTSERMRLDGISTLENLTNQQIYAAVYEYNNARQFSSRDNTFYGIYVLSPHQIVKVTIPMKRCIAQKGFAQCDEQTRRRLFVDDTDQALGQGLVNSAILSIDQSLWFSKIIPDSHYVAFHNGLFFDPRYATTNKITKKSAVDWRDGDDTDGVFIYPNRLNVVEKTKDSLPVIKNYVAFQEWITKQ